MGNEGLQAIVGLFSTLIMPLIVSWIVGEDWNDAIKYTVALCTCIVLGAVTAVADGNVDLANIAGSAGVIGMSATGLYHLYFKNTPLNKSMQSSGAFRIKGGHARTYTDDPTDDR